jgi:hypothetical protein
MLIEHKAIAAADSQLVMNLFSTSRMRTMESQTTNIACLGLDSELSFRFSFE